MELENYRAETIERIYSLTKQWRILDNKENISNMFDRFADANGHSKETYDNFYNQYTTALGLGNKFRF